jgi:hypothetical protein
MQNKYKKFNYYINNVRALRSLKRRQKNTTLRQHRLRHKEAMAWINNYGNEV